MRNAEALKDFVGSGVSRREFAKRAMVGGVAVAGAVALAGLDTEVAAQELTDIDVLNFALNLEYLEAEFYTVALSGQRIEQIGIGVAGVGQAGATTGGGQVSLSPQTRRVTEHIALDEQQHVRFLRAALGRAAIAKPAINLEALGLGFRNEQEFLTLARAFEDLGMSAYAGAVTLISSRQILMAAAQIGLTEAQHVGNVRFLVSAAGFAVPQVDTRDVPPLGSPAGRLYQVDGNGLSTARTAAEVLAVAYAGGERSGGFFPNGANGTIR
ncbi:ferritin-like domain-containing protein [soil metagenome]|nr:ferritin-like domain-containing protein [Acidobacteriota bacterium]